MYGIESQNFCIKITASCSYYEIGSHGEKNFKWKLWNIVMKNTHSEDDTFHTTSNIENFKRGIFIIKVLPRNCLK